MFNLRVKINPINLAQKNVIAGLGEIGSPILQLISKVSIAVGFDTNEKLMDKKKLKRYEKLETSFLHICIPFNKNFDSNVTSLYNKFRPEIIVIHSTISPGTTSKLQSKL